MNRIFTVQVLYENKDWKYANSSIIADKNEFLADTHLYLHTYVKAYDLYLYLIQKKEYYPLKAIRIVEMNHWNGCKTNSNVREYKEWPSE